MKQSRKLISLKEASKLTGYAPDYIGQLIRSGKLRGEKVHFNVAWMTTEDAVREYFERAEPGGKGWSIVRQLRRTVYRLRSDAHPNNPLLARFAHLLLYIAIVVSVVILVVLFYVLAVNIDRRVNESAILRSEPARGQLPGNQ